MLVSIRAGLGSEVRGFSLFYFFVNILLGLASENGNVYLLVSKTFALSD